MEKQFPLCPHILSNLNRHVSTTAFHPEVFLGVWNSRPLFTHHCSHHILHILHILYILHPPPHKFQSSGRASWTLPPSLGVSGATPWLSPSAWGVPHRSPTTGPRRWTTVSTFELVVGVWKWGKPPIYSNIHGENDYKTPRCGVFPSFQTQMDAERPATPHPEGSCSGKADRPKELPPFPAMRREGSWRRRRNFFGISGDCFPSPQEIWLEIKSSFQRGLTAKNRSGHQRKQAIPLVIRMVAADRLILHINTTYIYMCIYIYIIY